MNKTGLLLMTLCLVLPGCISGPNGQVRSLGTVTAVNASEQTILIKTDEGQSLTMSVAATTDLRDGEGQFRWKKKTTLDQIKAGQYLVVKQSPNSEGKLIADSVYVYNQRPANLRGASPTTSAAAPTAASTTGSPTVSTLGPSFKPGETIPADKAIIYVYRPNNPIGAGEWFFGTGSAADVGIHFPVKANGKLVTTLVKGGYYAYLTEPGQIVFTAFDNGFMAPSSVFSITVDAKAGQAYYLKGAHGKGMAGRARLTLVPPEVGASEITNCQLIP
jgi:hypothetical protein